MNGIFLYTSGSTDTPKKIFYSWNTLKKHAARTVKEIQITEKDIILSVFPANTIAHWTITSYPSQLANATLYQCAFNPFQFVEDFKRISPTIISLIPKHLNFLEKTKSFNNLDMSCVKYMVTGSGKIDDTFIQTFKNKGVKTVANWYGMTEAPPPVFIGYNSTKFDMDTIDKSLFTVTFKTHPQFDLPMIQECYINNKPTGDLFNIESFEFYGRTKKILDNTWKTSPLDY